MDSKNTKQSLHLPEEIIEEILSRLAVKSLLKFRCVSKSWHSLIGSERFIKKHHQNSTRNTTLAVLLSSRYKVELSQCPLPSLFDKHDIPALKWDFATDIFIDSITLVGCCNGLVCILLNHEHVILWNPSTRISRILPETPGYKHWFYGFGCDESSGDYKVIASADEPFERKNNIAKIYSLKTDSWKETTGPWELFMTFRAEQRGMLASGKLHWEIISYGIVSFDLKEEVFEIVEESFEEEHSDCAITTLAESGIDQLSLMNVQCLFIDVCRESAEVSACEGLQLIKYSTYDYGIHLRGWEFTEAAYYDCRIYVESLVSPKPSTSTFYQF